MSLLCRLVPWNQTRISAVYVVTVTKVMVLRVKFGNRFNSLGAGLGNIWEAVAFFHNRTAALRHEGY